MSETRREALKKIGTALAAGPAFWLAACERETAKAGRGKVDECLHEAPAGQPLAAPCPEPKPSEPEGESELPEDMFFSEDGVQPNFADALKEAEGLRWVGRLSGNGGREVGIFIPPGFDDSKPFEVIYHFHGTKSHLIKNKEDEGYVGENRLKQVLGSAQKLGKDPKRNVVVVYPLSAGHRARPGHPLPKGEYDADWMRSGNSTNDDMARLHSEVLGIIKSQFKRQIQAERITVKGHSAGGRPLMNIAESANQTGLTPNRFDFLDASYGDEGINWAVRCRRHLESYGSADGVELNIFLIPNSPTDRPWVRALSGQTGIHIIEARRPHADMNTNYFGWERRP